MATTTATNPKVATHRLAPAVVATLFLFSAACSSIVLETDNDRVGGSGDVTTETRSITEFERIVLAGEGTVVLEAGPDGQVEVETDDNLLTHLRTDVSGDTLTISTEPGTDIDPTSGVTYRLGCPEITAVVLSGAGTIDLASCATTGRLRLGASRERERSWRPISTSRRCGHHSPEPAASWPPVGSTASRSCWPALVNSTGVDLRADDCLGRIARRRHDDGVGHR